MSVFFKPTAARWLSPLAFLSLLGHNAAAQTPEASTPALATTVVTASRLEQPLTDVLADLTVVDRETIERSGATSLVDVLSRVAGVEFARQGGPANNTDLFVRGGESRWMAVYVDGIRLDSQSGSGGAAFSAIPLRQVERIEVLKGAASAVYGSDAMVGVVQVFTRRGDENPGPKVSVGVGSRRTHQVDLSLGGGGDGVDYSLSVSQEGSSGYHIRVEPNTNKDADGYLQKSFHGVWGWAVAPGHRLRLTALASTSDAQYDASTTALGRVKDDHALRRMQATGVTWEADWSATYTTTVSVSESQDRYETLSDGVQSSLADTRLRNVLWQNRWTDGAHQWSGSFEHRADDLTNRGIAQAMSRTQNGVALGYGYREGAHTLQWHTRHDQDSEFGGQTTSGVAYANDIAEGWRVSASVGTAFRAPSLYQRFHPTFGNAALQPESTRSAELTLRHSQGGSGWSLTHYRSSVDNLIYFDQTLNRYLSTQSALLQGWTLQGHTQAAGWNWRASLDLQNPRDLTNNRPLPRRARQHGVLSADTTWAGWRVGADWAVTAHRYNYSGAVVSRMPGYGKWDLHASKALNRHWNMRVRVDNVGDKAYQTALNYAMPGRTLFVGFDWQP